jgi:tetratricopeptide (TPR) repeat protein
VCVKLDMDERLVAGWRDELERAWAPGVTRLRYEYVWSWRAGGEPDVVFRNDLIHARSGYAWRHPTHESLWATGAERVAECGVRVHHFPEAKDRPDDLPLLELAVREDRSPRTLFYLGREYHARGKWEPCQETLGAYLAHPEAGWYAERAHAMRMLADCRARSGDRRAAKEWLYRACSEFPAAREGWVDLAALCLAGDEWGEGYHAAKRALAVTDRPAYPSGGPAWAERPHDVAAVCAWYLGMRAEAAAHMREALRLNPRDPRILANARVVLGNPPKGG